MAIGTDFKYYITNSRTHCIEYVAKTFKDAIREAIKCLNDHPTLNGANIRLYNEHPSNECPSTYIYRYHWKKNGYYCNCYVYTTSQIRNGIWYRKHWFLNSDGKQISFKNYGVTSADGKYGWIGTKKPIKDLIEVKV